MTKRSTEPRGAKAAVKRGANRKRATPKKAAPRTKANTRKRVMIVGTDAWSRIVAIPKSVHAERARLWSGLRNSTTFGELKASIAAEDYETVLTLTEHIAEETEAGTHWPPSLEREFHAESLSGWDERDWPAAISSLMAQWLRGMDLAGIATHQWNMVSDPWMHIDPDDKDKFVRALEAIGWEVKESNALIAKADWSS